MPTTSVSATTPILRTKFGRAWSRQLRAFLFQSDSGEWLSILRIGLGLEVTLYASSLWADWGRMFAGSSTGFLNREFTEAVLSIQSPLVPRIGWFVWMGERAGLSELTTLMIVWLLLFAAGCFLVVGLCCRTAAIAAWLIHLCSAKTGGYLAYGMDNFLTIGLFYLAARAEFLNPDLAKANPAAVFNCDHHDAYRHRRDDGPISFLTGDDRLGFCGIWSWLAEAVSDNRNDAESGET